jgi:RNA polymerase sigma-70 factor (ECF subfamily)
VDLGGGTSAWERDRPPFHQNGEPTMIEACVPLCSWQGCVRRYRLFRGSQPARPVSHRWSPLRLAAARWHNGPVSREDSSDGELLARLRAGDESAFRALVNRHHAAMVHAASYYVASRSLAEEVTQDTWLAVIGGLWQFEGRSSLRTWIFGVLVNQARARGRRESKTIPFSSIVTIDDEPTVDPGRFLDSDHPWAGHWAGFPQPWSDIPAQRLVDAETRTLISDAVRALPEAQRLVITLRDVDGWNSLEVCHLLGITAANQRVLLHRARARVRAVLERHFAQVVRT